MSGKIVKRQRVQEKLNSQQRLVVAQHTQYSGPIPPASELEKYETILKGSANRILKVFENQSSHRMQLEKIVVRGGETMQLLGWISSLIITMTCIIWGFYLINTGKDTTGIVTIIGALGTLLWVFAYWKSQSKKELAEKNPRN